MLHLNRKYDSIVPHRSIGVSNFNLEQLQLLVKEAKVVPAVNQVCRRAMVAAALPN